MSEGMNVAGLREIKAALEQLGISAEKSIVRKGLRIGCKVVLAAAKSEAPELSGASKRNIKIRGGSSKKG